MIQASYEELVKLISDSSQIGPEEIKKRVHEKKAKLSDLISLEGAAQIIAAELGVSFDKQTVKIDGLLVGMRKVSMQGKVMKSYPIRTFKTKNREGKVANLLLADETGIVKMVLWDANHIKMLEEKKINEGDVIEIKEGNVRSGTYGKELHLGSVSQLIKSDKEITNVASLTPASESRPLSRKIAELTEEQRASLRAVIVQAFEPKMFTVCPECGRKAVNEGDRFTCMNHGAVIPKERALMSVVLDDGTANIRAVTFSEVISKLFKVSEEEVKNLADKKNDILGKEIIFTGRAKKNKIYDSLEFIVNDAEEADPGKLIGELSRN